MGVHCFSGALVQIPRYKQKHKKRLRKKYFLLFAFRIRTQTQNHAIGVHIINSVGIVYHQRLAVVYHQAADRYTLARDDIQL